MIHATNQGTDRMYVLRTTPFFPNVGYLYLTADAKKGLLWTTHLPDAIRLHRVEEWQRYVENKLASVPRYYFECRSYDSEYSNWSQP
jgi:hypothetical protein